MREVLDWQASAVLNRSKRGEPMGFHYSLNPYRGCSHACRYCYARESHTYLGLNTAEDFEQKLFVKSNLAVRMEAELAKIPPHAVIAIGTVTDPYQPLEGRYRLTRTAVQLLAHSGHAFTITTKSPLIERDLDVLATLGQRHQAGVHVSLISLDRKILQQLEPGTSSPQRRLETVRALKAAGIPVGVFVAPIVPGVTDSAAHLDELFHAIHQSGADWVMTSTTRLSPAIRDYFITAVGRFDPAAAAYIRSLYGQGQYARGAYRYRLDRLIEDLLTAAGLSHAAPVLRAACEPSPQIEFAFD